MNMHSPPQATTTRSPALGSAPAIPDSPPPPRMPPATLRIRVKTSPWLRRVLPTRLVVARAVHRGQRIWEDSQLAREEALAMMKSAIGFLNAADATQMATGEQARCLQAFEEFDAAETAARASILGGFTTRRVERTVRTGAATPPRDRFNLNLPRPITWVKCERRRTDPSSADVQHRDHRRRTSAAMARVADSSRDGLRAEHCVHRRPAGRASEPPDSVPWGGVVRIGEPSGS